jgi:hypothetical protein
VAVLKTASLVGLLLILLGIVSLAYQGIFSTSEFAQVSRVCREIAKLFARCGFGGAGMSRFRNHPGQYSEMKPGSDSDFKPVTFRRLSEP